MRFYSSQKNNPELARNLIARLIVSFVAISLAAALDILSTRGAFFGILSVGMMTLITAVFDRSRIQSCPPTIAFSCCQRRLTALPFFCH
ncbi:MAG: hypothetical protein P8L18_07700 [Verrucomicrobiota bacterium]|jgi:hypothetical protein|nr:hypothetical protein [Verrucomicrobiota bacterium]